MRILSLRNELILITMLLITVSSVCSANTTSKACSSITYGTSENKIVFTFDKEYKCGQYTNGDWWVSVDSTGVLKLVGVSPASLDGLNGMELNPISKLTQGFDRRINGYNAGLDLKTPALIPSNSSVVKTISLIPVKGKKCRPCIKYAAVLTVTGESVIESDHIFRPGYFGKKKKTYSLEHSVFERLLSLPASCCSSVGKNDFNNISRRYQGVMLDHLEGWVGRSLHPVDSMPDYGAQIATDNAVSALRFLLDDFDPDKPSHKSALINYLQMSIDLESMAAGGVSWPGKGGHGNGRKLPILFAWYLFKNNDFLAVLDNVSFSEDEQVYFSEKIGRPLYGAKCSDKRYWLTTISGRGPRDCRDPYGFIDGGGHEIGGAYQVCCTAMPWKYTALVIRLLGLEAEWGNSSFLNYVDRWVNHGVWAAPDPCAPYNGNMNEYLKNYGAKTDNSCINGQGRYLRKHGTQKDAGNYRNMLGDQLWKAYRYAMNEEME